MGANEIFTVMTPHVRAASTVRAAPFLPLVPAPTQPRCPRYLGQRPMLAHLPSPELVGQGLWGAASFWVRLLGLSSKRPGAQQSLNDEQGAHQEAWSSDNTGLPTGPWPASDSASPDSGAMGEGLRGCLPKTQATGGAGADRAGPAIPFQTPS